MYRLAAHYRRYRDVARFVTFPVRYTSFIEIENQFSCASLDVFFQLLQSSLEEHLWYLQILLFFRDNCRLDDFIGVTKGEHIYPAPNDWSLKLTRTVILDFLSRNGCAPFSVLSNPVRNLLLTVSIKESMRSSIFRRMQVMVECQSQSISWTIKCTHQRIDRNWNIMPLFADIASSSNLLALNWIF
jgi:hypothetical protein